MKKVEFCGVKIHRIYMRRCIEIARNGLGTTAPNPMVGAVIVHKGKIIGEGYTSAYGGAHAERNAIKSVGDPGLLKEAILYVTLEPCSHFGKTPPCADLIIQHQIPKVVIGLLDPHIKVAGKGIRRLRESGCEVTVGVLEAECREHHKRFLTFHEKKRPYIILKWAETADGFIAPEKNKRSEKPKPFWITHSYARQRVHQWRAEEQAILIGTTTALEDNPRLDVRKWNGKNPLRIVLDKNLKIPKNSFLLDGSTESLILTALDNTLKQQQLRYESLDFSNRLAEQICAVLFKENITSVLIEGGTKTIQTFIDSRLWDEARVFKGEITFKKGIKAPELTGKKVSKESIGSDILELYRP